MRDFRSCQGYSLHKLRHQGLLIVRVPISLTNLGEIKGIPLRIIGTLYKTWSPDSWPWSGFSSISVSALFYIFWYSDDPFSWVIQSTNYNQHIRYTYTTDTASMAQVLLKHNSKLHYITVIIAHIHTYTWFHKEYRIKLTTQGQHLHLPPN